VITGHVSVSLLAPPEARLAPAEERRHALSLWSSVRLASANWSTSHPQMGIAAHDAPLGPKALFDLYKFRQRPRSLPAVFLKR
jgi:hypothetical protein